MGIYTGAIASWSIYNHASLMTLYFTTKFIGYYATGPDLTLVAIRAPTKPQDPPIIYDIVSANLRLRRDRIKNICRLINLSRLFRSFTNLVQLPDVEFTKLQRFDLFQGYLTCNFKSLAENLVLLRLRAVVLSRPTPAETRIGVLNTSRECITFSRPRTFHMWIILPIPTM